MGSFLGYTMRGRARWGADGGVPGETVGALPLFFLAGAGLAIGACFVLITGVELKAAAIVAAVMLALVCWPISAFFPGTIEKVLLFGMAVTLSISVKKHLVFR